ncbi:MAG: hypothetical protein JW735_03830 [Prolixibacteraceae bacterium]|nr:hypothetical protein [Prolixibacteraceae bacterium]
MKTNWFLVMCLFVALSISSAAQIDLSKKIPGIKYQSSYTFDAVIEMQIDFYSPKGKLQESIPYYGHYTNDYQYINIKHKRGNTVYQTLFDIPNNNCLIILGEGEQVMGSASVMKDNSGRTLKELNLLKTNEEKSIAGKNSTKYTFDVPEFKGEMWITQQVKLPNDVGILKASKMGKYYQQLSVDGFVMEITSITPKGRKTVMKTLGFNSSKPLTVTIPEEFGRAINKIDYYEY